MDEEYAKYLLQKTKEDYNLIAEGFSRTRGGLWEEFGFLKNYFFPGDKILDLGCGNGRLLELLKNQEIDYIGIDSSKRLIEIAKKKYPEAKFQIGDALNLLFPDNFFDKVFSIAVLHHIPSEDFRVQFLKEVKRVLKPEGILFLTVWYLWQKKTAWKDILKFFFLKLMGKSKVDFKDIFYPWKNSQGEAQIQRYFHCFTAKEIKKLFKRTSFEIKKIRLLKRSAGHYNLFVIAKK